MAVDMTKIARGTVVAERVGRDGRSLTSELATGVPSVVLAVSTFHRNGGQYRTTAMGVRHMPSDGPFRVSKSSPMDSALIGTNVEGARFSRKNLDRIHESMVAATLALLADDSATLARVIAATPGAGG